MLRKLINKIRMRINGETGCSASWSQQNYDDWDGGCLLDQCKECCECGFRFVPNFIINLLVNLRQRKIEKYWQLHSNEL
jgi:hypothetical protein